MKYPILCAFLILAFQAASTAAASVVRRLKEGQRFEFGFHSDAKAIIRYVPAGSQVFYLEGENEGYFVNGKGKRIYSSNYEIHDGNLVIKKFTKADVGSYTEHPREGQRVEFKDMFSGAKAISRNVPAGWQIFHLEGENKGYFVNGDGKRVDSSNYEIYNGNLVIKKFTKADLGGYAEHPTKRICDRNPDGSNWCVLGPHYITRFE